MMFAQANSEHCRHNADWTIDGVAQTKSLLAGMIKNTHAAEEHGLPRQFLDHGRQQRALSASTRAAPATNMPHQRN